MNKFPFFLVFLLLVCPVSKAQETFQLRAPGSRSYFNYLVVPTQADWQFSLGEEASVDVYAQAGGNPVEGVELHFFAGKDMMDVDTTGSVIFEQGRAHISFGKMEVPGYRTLSIQFSFEGKNYNEMYKVAFAPAAIRPTVEMPKDFDAYWRKSKREAAKVPMQTEIVPLPALSTESTEVSLVKLSCWPLGHNIYGYLCKPRGKTKCPVLLVPPGAGVKRFNPNTGYAEAGFISFTTEIHGVSPYLDPDEFKQQSGHIGGYINTGLDDRDNFYMKKVYLSLVRSIDFLLSLPEWDGKTVGVHGSSQGGALAIVSAGLDERIQFVSSISPAFCDLTAYLYDRAAGWPRYFSKEEIAKLPVPVETAVKTLSYYDVVNFARRIQVPGFYAFGYCDNTCPPTPVTAAFNSIQAEKTMVITPTSAHWRFEETSGRHIEWLKNRISPAAFNKKP